MSVALSPTWSIAGYGRGRQTAEGLRALAPKTSFIFHPNSAMNQDGVILEVTYPSQVIIKLIKIKNKENFKSSQKKFVTYIYIKFPHLCNGTDSLIGMKIK